MPTGPLGGKITPGLHDEGLRGGDLFANTTDQEPSQIVAGPENSPLTISGVTRNAAGSPLGGCLVRMFAVGAAGVSPIGDVEVGVTTSDGSGNFSLPFAYPEYAYYLVAYLAGSPDVFGTSANTLKGS